LITLLTIFVFLEQIVINFVVFSKRELGIFFVNFVSLIDLINLFLGKKFHQFFYVTKIEKKKTFTKE